MADEAKAMATMIANIEAKTGKTLAQLSDVVKKSTLTQHAELREMLMEKFGLGHGQANTVVHLALKSDGASAAAAAGHSADDVMAQIYSGKKEALRPIHDAVLDILRGLGDFEAAPKKDYISYRRKKQFLMAGPKTATAVELGFGAKALPANARLK
jgi:3-methyladenine DNA glycosylase/8-oxoguanine DNA glycosylase